MAEDENSTEGRLIVVKVGSTLLTEANGKLSRDKLSWLVESLAEARKRGKQVVLVSSGATAAGFERLGYQQRPSRTAARQASAAVGQGLLIHAYSEELAKFEIPAAQVLLTRRDFAVRDAYNNALNTFNLLLARGALPIVNENDCVSSKGDAFGENDILAALLAALLHADMLMILTDRDGLYESDPAKNSNALRLARVEEITSDVMQLAESTTSQIGSGGMAAKLKAAKFALSMGVSVFIGSGVGECRERLARILEGVGEGTYFGSPANESVRRKKQWIGYHSGSEGRIVIDGGAEEALLRKGKSLLTAGLAEIKGNFRAEEVVEVYSVTGDLIGRGIVNFSADQLKQVQGKSTAYVREHFKTERVEVIHRDNWVSLMGD